MHFLKKRFGELKIYEEWCESALIDNTLELMDAEIPKYAGKIKMLHLCFTTNPFMYDYPEIQSVSIEAIRKANSAGVKCSVLTKGILPFELSHLSHDNYYGITLVSLSEDFRKQYELGADPIDDRLASLRALHDVGCKTWVSIELYLTPNIIEQKLSDLLCSISFVDKIIFGQMNYNKAITGYKERKEFFNQCAEEVINFCNKKRIAFHIKEGTIT